MAKESVIVVGAGSISNQWFGPLLAEAVEVRATVDLRPDVAAAQVAKHGLAAEVSDDLEAMLRKHRPDFVLDLTVPEAHCGVTLAALRAGCHVLGEKPMAATMAEARRMVKAADAAGRLYAVSQSRRWERRHDAICRTVEAGRLGRVSTVNCDFYIAAHFGGFREAMPSPLILDMAIHHFDLARMFTGAAPAAVYAKEYNPAGSWYAGDAAATCVFEMSDGIVFTYRGSWCSEGCHTSWNGDWRIVGEKGTLVYAGDGEPHGQVVAGRGEFHSVFRELDVVASPLTHPTMHGALREMLEFLRTGRRPQTECHDNIQSLAMVFAAIESARKGRRVPIRL
jgi:predicted dehydrogenase